MDIKTLFAEAQDIIDRECQRNPNEDLQRQAGIVRTRHWPKLHAESDIINCLVIQASSYSVMRKYFQVLYPIDIHYFDRHFGTRFFPARAARLTEEIRLAEGQVPDEEESLEDDEDSARDLLGEMEIAARIMITGGDERENARLTRADRLIIRKAILAAAETVRGEGRDRVLTEDVVRAFQVIAQDPNLPELRRYRAQEMGDGLELFCSGLAGRFFNRPGTQWPDADVTLLEMGILAREGYEDQLTVAFLGMMNHINGLVERQQYDQRQTLVVADEGHIITTNPLLAPYVVKITKMWRKLGTWFWIATQNLQDFPDAGKRMLNMMEWWLCLVMPKEEVEEIARFRELTAEQRAMLLSAHKEPGKYVEGVVLGDQLEALFRSVPPPLCLALAMTDPEEKAERAQIMRELGCSELEAAQKMAARMEQARG